MSKRRLSSLGVGSSLQWSLCGAALTLAACGSITSPSDAVAADQADNGGGAGGAGSAASGGIVSRSATLMGAAGAPPTPPPPAKFSHYFADVSGDGRPDWIQVSRTTNEGWVGLSSPGAFFHHWTNYDPQRGAGQSYEHYFADVNGDGKADWIQVSRTTNNGWVGLANGLTFTSFEHWTNSSPSRGAVKNFAHYFADVNGDGKADWIQVSRTTDHGWVGLANANDDSSFNHWTNTNPSRGAVNNYEHYFADVNGDGKADWIRVSRTINTAWIGLANANGDGNFNHWTFTDTNRGAVDNYAHYFADVNGDHRADWIQVSRTTNNGWVGFANADGSFAHWSQSSTSPGAVKDYAHYFADVNGDGQADWIQVSRTTNHGWIGVANADGFFTFWTRDSTHPGAVKDYAHYFVDTNADGKADWIQVSRTINNGWIALANANAPDGNFTFWTNESGSRGAVY